MKYRAEIDGLRAIAVVPVILFHAGFELFNGGFVGVDVFFVISGYLISTILIEEIENERFSFGDFYSRRARRILPALYTVMFVTFMSVLILWSPYDVKNVSQSIVATVLFSHNVLLIMEGNDYFAALNRVSDINPLIHTWSLAVEEQFYLIFPLILLAFNKFKIKQTFFLCFLISLGFFISSILSYNGNSEVVFYATYHRSWQLLSGALCALVLYKKYNLLNNLLGSILSFVGLLLVIVCIFGLVSTQAFGYWFYLIPTIGASLVILYTKSNNFVGILLSNNFLVGVGLISYSLYLWHQPVFSLLTYKLIDTANGNHSLSFFHTMLALVSTLMLAILTYYLVEKPFRKGVFSRSKIINPFLILASVILLVIGVLGNQTQGYLDWKINSDYALYVSYDDEKARVKRSSWGKEKNVGSRIGVIGDSASQDLQQAFLSTGLQADRYSLDGPCFKIIVEKLTCDNKSINDLLEFSASKEKIFIASNILSENSIDGYLALYKTLEPFTDVYIIGPFEFWKATNISFAAFNSPIAADKFFFKGLDTRIVSIENSLISEIHPRSLISKYRLYCDENKETCSFYDSNNNPIFYDGIHHTVEGWHDYGVRLENYFRSIDLEIIKSTGLVK